MRRKIMKLQRRSHNVAINIPTMMKAGIGDDVRYMEVRQYNSGKITLWPIHEDVKK